MPATSRLVEGRQNRMTTSPLDPSDVPAYVEAAARVLAMPLADERFDAVVAVMRRLAAFARDIDALELAPDVEVAGVFIP